MQKDDKAQAHKNDAETELEMSGTAGANQRTRKLIWSSRSSPLVHGPGPALE
jgi:hypothetical protein